jgi:hypothetical protein
MIDENTPYKLAEIIRNTWPQLFRHKKVVNDNQQDVTHCSAPVIPRVLNNKDLIDNH